MKKNVLVVNSVKIAKILDNARASLSVEGLIVTENESMVVRKFLEGSYSEKEVLRIIANS